MVSNVEIYERTLQSEYDGFELITIESDMKITRGIRLYVFILALLMLKIQLVGYSYLVPMFAILIGLLSIDIHKNLKRKYEILIEHL